MSIKIVLVDDDKVTLAYLEHFLTGNLFSVHVAQDGQTAWELVQREKPHILVTDLLLPKIDGLELCKKVKQDPNLSQTKVIITTAVYKESTVRPVVRESGADAFIGKPVRSTELLEKIYSLYAEIEGTGKKDGSS
jgi:two-component system alkaline phosphatase synthesis response regulator PhoP